MTVFSTMAELITNKINELASDQNNIPLRVDIDGDELWDIYLETIPEEHNPIFRERREYDGNYDKNFIRRLGNLVFLNNNKLISIFDIEPMDTFFDDVVKKLSKSVKKAGIKSFFLEKEKVAGHKPNYDTQNPEILWEHFYIELPNRLYNYNYRDSILGELSAKVETLTKSLEEVDLNSLWLVLELLESDTVYRGEEHIQTIKKWIEYKEKYDSIKSIKEKELYIYSVVGGNNLIYLRNTVIGSLVIDIQNGKDLEEAVKSFEHKVAPLNYKRTKSIVTPRMIENAKETIDELGYRDSIYRTFAREKDIPLNHILFNAYNDNVLNIFDEMVEDSKASTKKINVESAKKMDIDTFMDNLNKYDKVELLPYSGIESNQFVLTKPKYEDSKNMFKWDNTFAWSYINSDTTDAIKERVKTAGGNVDGEFRVSLAWHNTDDLDLHCILPDKRRIYFVDRTILGGTLDVDMNVRGESNTPVENIFWKYISDMPDGKYQIEIDQYNRRNSNNVGFTLQLEIKGNITNFEYKEIVDFRNKCVLTLAKQGDEIKISSINKVKKTSEIIKDKFIKVEKILLSPNYWGDDIGNKHYLFLTNDFEIEKPVRGFFNEYLKAELNKDRKVFEIMGDKLKIKPDSKDIARGYGFSSTSKNKLLVRVTKNKRQSLLEITI